MPKLQFAKVKYGERDALRQRFREALHNVKFDGLFGSNIAAFTDEFKHTTNINDARWLYADSHYANVVIRINNDGSMSHIKEEF